MNQKKLKNSERNRLERWSQFQFSHKLKRIGIFLSLLTIGVMISLKFMEGDFLIHKFIARRVLLIGLLIITLSKEPIEDEMIVSIRAKSFTLAFVIAVVYALIQPLVNASVFYLIDNKDMVESFGYFQVLTFMLLTQIFCYEFLKRTR